VLFLKIFQLLTEGGGELVGLINRRVALGDPPIFFVPGGAGRRAIGFCIAAGLVGFELVDEALDGLVGEVHFLGGGGRAIGDHGGGAGEKAIGGGWSGHSGGGRRRWWRSGRGWRPAQQKNCPCDEEKKDSGGNVFDFHPWWTLTQFLARCSGWADNGLGDVADATSLRPAKMMPWPPVNEK